MIDIELLKNILYIKVRANEANEDVICIQNETSHNTNTEPFDGQD